MEAIVNKIYMEASYYEASWMLERSYNLGKECPNFAQEKEFKNSEAI